MANSHRSFRAADAPAADMALAYASQCRAQGSAPGPDAPVVAEMTDALVAANYPRVLELKEKLPAKTAANGWVEYNVASALVGLGKIDDAIAAFARAERAFGEGDPRGRAIAVWGRARALAMGNRCPESRQVFDEYINVVGASDPAAARMAETYSKHCS